MVLAGIGMKDIHCILVRIHALRCRSRGVGDAFVTAQCTSGYIQEYPVSRESGR